MIRIALPLASLLLFAVPALADETNPAVEACKGKKDGDACQTATVNKPAEGDAERSAEPGVCKPDQCCTLDYSSGSPPKSVCSECLACKAGAPEPSAEGGNASGGEPPRTSDGGAPVATTEPPPTEPGKKGCRIAAAPGALPWTAAPVTLWPLLAVVVIGRRRRSRG